MIRLNDEISAYPSVCLPTNVVLPVTLDAQSTAFVFCTCVPSGKHLQITPRLLNLILWQQMAKGDGILFHTHTC